MEEGDIGDAARLMADVDGEDGDPEAMEVLLRSSNIPAHFPFVAVNDGREVCGVIVWQTIEVQRTRFILSLAWVSVKQEFRRNGLGKELIFETVGVVVSDAFLCHRELGYFIIEVDSLNEQALRFYRSLFVNADESRVGEYIYFVVQPQEVLKGGTV